MRAPESMSIRSHTSWALSGASSLVKHIRYAVGVEVRSKGCFMTDRAGRQRLRTAIVAEIMRRVSQLDDLVTRAEVERIGAREGAAAEEAAREFLSLKGVTWEGQLGKLAELGEASPEDWDYVRFDRAWFERTGRLARP